MKIAILSAAYQGMAHIKHAHSVTSAILHLKELGHDVEWIYYGNVASTTKARNALVSEGLYSGADKLVFIDTDIVFAADGLERLINHEHDLIGGVQMVKRPGDGAQFPWAFMVNDGRMSIRGGVSPVDGISTAFLSMTRTMLLDLIEKHPELSYYDGPVTGAREGYLAALFDYTLHPHPQHEGSQRYYGEDYSFCLLAKEAGYQPYADLGIPLGHIKQIELGDGETAIGWLTSRAGTQ